MIYRLHAFIHDFITHCVWFIKWNRYVGDKVLLANNYYVCWAAISGVLQSDREMVLWCSVVHTITISSDTLNTTATTITTTIIITTATFTTTTTTTTATATLRGLSPRANYTDRAAAAGQRS